MAPKLEEIIIAANWCDHEELTPQRGQLRLKIICSRLIRLRQRWTRIALRFGHRFCRRRAACRCRSACLYTL